MLRSSPAIQKQLSDAVSIIGKYDFPKKWPQLIDEMVEKFAGGDFHVINGVLQTAHSIFKRYRYEFKSQELWEEIKFVLDKFAKPLTDLMFATMSLAKTHENNEPVLRILYGSIVLVTKVFYSLNAQDLPEFFEDNMETWMNAFHELLIKDIPCLHTGEDEDAGVLEQLRSQICYNLGLYAQKYDEEFGNYMQQFVTDVWGLLVKTGIQTKYDSVSVLCNCNIPTVFTPVKLSFDFSLIFTVLHSFSVSVERLAILVDRSCSQPLSPVVRRSHSFGQHLRKSDHSKYGLPCVRRRIVRR